MHILQLRPGGGKTRPTIVEQGQRSGQRRVRDRGVSASARRDRGVIRIEERDESEVPPELSEEEHAFDSDFEREDDVPIVDGRRLGRFVSSTGSAGINLFY